MLINHRVMKAGETSWLEQAPSLARALLESIGTGAARSRRRILSYIGCTLESVRLTATPRPETTADVLLGACIDRALEYLLHLDLVRVEPGSTCRAAASTQVEGSASAPGGDDRTPEAAATRDERALEVYSPTSLGTALLNSSIEIALGLAVFRDLNRARKSLILESDLHLVYLVSSILEFLLFSSPIPWNYSYSYIPVLGFHMQGTTRYFLLARNYRS